MQFQLSTIHQEWMPVYSSCVYDSSFMWLLSCVLIDKGMFLCVEKLTVLKTQRQFITFPIDNAKNIWQGRVFSVIVGITDALIVLWHTCSIEHQGNVVFK